MTSAVTFVHLLGALRRAAGRVFLSFLITLIVVAAATEGIYFLVTTPHRIDNPLTHILAALMAVGWAVAVSLLVLVGEIVRGLVSGVRDTVKDVEKEVGEAGSLVGGVIQSVEGKNQPPNSR
jgi:hypothetical protein